MLLEVYARIHEHAVCPLLQKNFQTFQIDDCIAQLGLLGYVHSQRGASTTGNDEYPYTVSCNPLLCNYIFKLVYRIVRQNNHYILLAVILIRNYP